MEQEGSLPHSQLPATCPYPVPDRSSPYLHIPLPEDPSCYYPPIYTWVFQVIFFLQVSPQTHVKIILLLIQTFSQDSVKDKRPVTATVPDKTLCFRIRLNQIGLYCRSDTSRFLKPCFYKTSLHSVSLHEERPP